MAAEGAHEAEKLFEPRLLQINPRGDHLSFFFLRSLGPFSFDSGPLCLEPNSLFCRFLGSDLCDSSFIQNRPADLRPQGKAFRVLTNAH